MNHLRLKAAVEKYKETAVEDLPAVLAADTEKNYTEDDIAEIVDAIKAGPPDTKHEEKAKGANDDLDLSAFDYDNLKGESFAKYETMIKSANGFKDRDFTQYMASGIFETKFDANLNKVEVLVGIRINNIKPVNHTRIPVRMAIDLNRQIMNKDNPATNSRYYLLKKPE